MSCSTFSSTNPTCQTFQIIEPDETLLTAVSSGSNDQSLDESGSTVISSTPPASLRVNFQTIKASTNYRFEYLYVDTPGISLPGAVQPVVNQTDVSGFTVQFAGLPIAAGYILRWRVVVIGLINATTPGTPENLRVPIPIGARTLFVTFANPRANLIYGFSELRVENLVDDPSVQRLINIQVTSKTLTNFTVGVNPPVDTNNYFLCVRAP